MVINGNLNDNDDDLRPPQNVEVFVNGDDLSPALEEKKKDSEPAQNGNFELLAMKHRLNMVH